MKRKERLLSDQKIYQLKENKIERLWVPPENVFLKNRFPELETNDFSDIV